MPLDPQAQAVVDAIRARGGPGLHAMTPAQARATLAAMPRPIGPDVASVVDWLVPGPSGPVSVRVCTPEGKGPFPAMVWSHGGGWIVGGHNSANAICRRIANAVGCIAVSVAYRKAPEHKFPAASEDAYATVKWLHENGGAINADPARIAIAGEASGGNVAAAAALMARDRGGPPLVFQLLVSPIIERDFGTDSYRDNGAGYRLTREMAEWYWTTYLPSDEDATNPYASPIHAESLGGLPPTLVLTPEYDPLRDDGKKYAAALKEAGVAVAYSEYAGQIHGFVGMPEEIDRANDALAEMAAALKVAFGS